MYKSPANTLFLGKNVVFVPECHSTNTLAAQLSQKPSATEGTVVITANQTAGRGQRGSSWTTEPGQNITLSLLLKPGFLTVSNQFYLNIIIALAVRDLVSDITDQVIHIKWPNDILVHRKKVCGILIENQLQGSRIDTAIVGIGLNVNQSAFDLDTATSIRLETNVSHNLQSVFDQLMECIEVHYLSLKQNRLNELRSQYLQHLYRRGERHRYESEGKTFEGEIIGIAEDGKLAVNADGEMKYFEVKQIRYL